VEKQQFSSLLTQELNLWQLILTGSLTTHRERLHDALKAESSLENPLKAMCQWNCPFHDKAKAVAPITMDNVCTRWIVSSLDELIDISVVDEGWKTLWTRANNNYQSAIVLLHKKEDFTNEQVASFQKQANIFFQSWVKLHGIEGVTNYIHMMGSGHFTEYLYKWKNLYRYSQQGWEAMNALIKTFYYHRTNHGGSTGNKGTSKKSRLVPIACCRGD
jgi:hypothetical protein